MRKYGKLEKEIEAGNLIPFDSSTDEEEDFGVVLTEETQTALRQAFDDIERKIAEKNKIPSQYKSA